jgi:hypothetical protein
LRLLSGRNSRVAATFVAVLLVLSLAYTQNLFSTARTSDTQVVVGPSQTGTGIIIPMFTNYSLIDVSQIIQAKTSNPSMPIIVVANPDDGPGPAYNATYAGGIRSLQQAGITVLGYDPTGWGDRSIASIESDALNFYHWYGVDGIYLDQMYNLEYSQSGTFMATYYSTLSTYVKSLGMTMVFGNSGADVPYYFVGTVDTIGYFENSHLPLLSVLGGWHAAYNKSNFAFFAYNVTSLNPYYIAAASDYVSYLYITNGERPSPYNSLGSYFDQLVSDVSSLVPVTVETTTPNGTLVNRGFNVTVTQPDGISSSGYSPSTFDVVKGSTVTITVKDNGGYIFDHWVGGGSKMTLSLTPKAATTLVAESRTSATNVSLVTVHTMEPDGTPVTGIWTTAAINGALVASGYTPFTFVAARGSNYSLEVANYSGYTFSSWENGTAKPSAQTISITPTKDILLNAYVLNDTAIKDALTASLPSSAAAAAPPRSSGSLPPR